jgi:16S rRNA (guanine527-N7)-methyltransferase
MQHLIAGSFPLGINLTHAQISNFQTYYEKLVEWNSCLNLTAITDYRAVQVKHFLDSLTIVLALPEPLPAGFKIIDVGSGGGFPGIPLKIVFPQIDLVLLESTGKKVEFLKHIVRSLALESVKVVTGRAEEVAHLSDYREQFDVAVARGLAQMAVLAELTLPFCRIEGHLVAQKKGEIKTELAASLNAITAMGGRLSMVKNIELSEFADKRCLVVIEKASPTPAEYPRRPGIPAKRPLF